MRVRGAFVVAALSVFIAVAAFAFVALGRRESVALPIQDVGSASEVAQTPMIRIVAAESGADRLLQRDRTGYPCGVIVMGCPPSTPVRQVPLILVRDSAGTIRAFVGEDPRNGCVLRWRPDIRPGVLYDPCHGSLYDRQGHIVGGPSPWDLNEWAIQLRADRILVNPSKIITGAALGFPRR